MVSAALHRRAPRGAQVLAALVVGTGRLIGYARRRVPLLPGLSGAALVAWGAAQVYTPAGWMAGGVFLLLIDRQIPQRGG